MTATPLFQKIDAVTIPVPDLTSPTPREASPE